MVNGGDLLGLSTINIRGWSTGIMIDMAPASAGETWSMIHGDGCGWALLLGYGFSIEPFLRSPWVTTDITINSPQTHFWTAAYGFDGNFHSFSVDIVW